jgi:hypothetical protein
MPQVTREKRDDPNAAAGIERDTLAQEPHAIEAWAAAKGTTDA